MNTPRRPDDTHDTPPDDLSRRVLLPKAPPPFTVNRGWLFIVAALIILAVGLVLINLNVLPPVVMTWLPLVVLLPALLIILIAVARRSPRGVLGGAALLGIALSLLLAAQGVAAVGSTLVGITLVTVGAGLFLRGLLLRGA